MSDIRETVISDFSDATYVENYRLFEDGTLMKRNGCKYIRTFPKPVRAIISYNARDVYIVSGDVLFLCRADVLYHAMTLEGANFSDDSEKCSIFIFGDILYIFAGGVIYTYDPNTVTRKVNVGYIPTISAFPELSCDETFNLMSERVREHSLVESKMSYKLITPPTEIFSVKIGERILNTSDYTHGYNDDGKYVITLTNPSLIEIDAILEVEYSVTQGDYADERRRFFKCDKSFVFEGTNESYLMLYNSSLGCVYYSKAREDENGNIVTGDYFPLNYKFTIGNGRKKIRAITQLSGRTVAITQDSIYYIVEENVTDSLGNKQKGFRAVPVDDELGISQNSGVQFFENDMYLMNSLGLYRVTYNPVDSKYSKKRIDIPENMKLSPQELEGAFLHIDRFFREIWCTTADKITVYSLTSKKWYCFTGFHPEACVICDNRTVFFSGNALCRFDPDAGEDFDSGIEASVQTDNIDFGNIFAKKTVYGFGVTFDRCEGAVIDCMLISDKGDTFSFTVNSDDDRGNSSPIVKRTHVRLSQCSYITCRITSKKDAATANIRELMFRYRIVD